jgi:L-fucose mutarotase
MKRKFSESQNLHKERLFIMLNGIPAILSPELLKILMEMGHGDELVLADGNFPAASHAQRLTRCDGHDIPTLLEAILQLFPLDQYVAQPVGLMAVVPGDTVATPIWDVYAQIVQKKEKRQNVFEHIERFAFYERAKNAYAIVATGESALYANIILKKGVIKT